MKKLTQTFKFLKCVFEQEESHEGSCPRRTVVPLRTHCAPRLTACEHGFGVAALQTGGQNCTLLAAVPL